MKLTLLSIAAVAVGAAAMFQTSARTEPKSERPGAKEIRGASPFLGVEDEPPPKLFVDQPLPEGLAIGLVWIQWRVENVNVVPIFGKGALNVSPRTGHLHVSVDDLPWWWADAGNVNTIDVAGLSAGPHKIRIDLVNSNHEPFPGQTKVVSFSIPKGAAVSR